MEKNIQPTLLRSKNKFKDFDALIAESRQDTITIKVGGKEYTAPAVMPAYVPVMMARYAGNELLTKKIIYDALFLIFGDEAAEAMLLTPGMDREKVEAIILQVFELINDEAENEPQEVNEGDEGVKAAPK